MKHVVRYGTPADAKFLLGNYRRRYDELVVNANMLAHAQDAISNFITQKIAGKEFFIDPQTHAFQHDLIYLQSSSSVSKTDQNPPIKRSIKKLLSAYGGPVENIVLKKCRPVNPKDFRLTKTLSEFCDRVLSFQKTSVQNALGNSDAAKYYEYIKNSSDDIGLFDRPKWLVAPYFYLTDDHFEEWLDLNIKLARSAKESRVLNDGELALQIVISQHVLDSDMLCERLLSEYTNNFKDHNFLLWVDNFNEHEASDDDLKRYANLIKRLSDCGRLTVLYGGYFSMSLRAVMKKDRGYGVTHSMEHGESRSVVPVGGGIPVAKFYLPDAHKRLDFRQAVRVVYALNAANTKDMFIQEICGCNQCRKIITNDVMDGFLHYGDSKTVAYRRQGHTVVREFPTQDAKSLSLQHYLFVKSNEYAEKSDKDAIIESLDVSHAKLKKIIPDAVRHLACWSRVLKDI